MSGAHPTGEHEALLTGDELARMPNHDLCELIDGRIVPMSPTNPEHGRLEANIGGLLRDFARAQNLGIVMTGEVGIFTKRHPDRVRAADVVFISHRRYASRTKTRGFLDVAPELVVEILSLENAHVDTQAKVQEYLAIGVGLVLIVDPDTKTITLHRRGGVSRYTVGEFVPCDDVLGGFGFPVAVAFE
jgi:Uma2 family endonuclease